MHARSIDISPRACLSFSQLVSQTRAAGAPVSVASRSPVLFPPGKKQKGEVAFLMNLGRGFTLGSRSEHLGLLGL